jgi:hypothetical protein
MSLNSCRLKGLNLTSIDKLHGTQVKFLLCLRTNASAFTTVSGVPISMNGTSATCTAWIFPPDFNMPVDRHPLDA